MYPHHHLHIYGTHMGGVWPTKPAPPDGLPAVQSGVYLEMADLTDGKTESHWASYLYIKAHSLSGLHIIAGMFSCMHILCACGVCVCVYV